MKNRGLTAYTKTLMMLICYGVLSYSRAQSQKISIERAQLIELTKKAEKAKLYEDENARLIVENYNLKQTYQDLTKEVVKAKKQAATYKQQRNQNRYALAALLIAVLVSIGLRVRKIFL